MNFRMPSVDTLVIGAAVCGARPALNDAASAALNFGHAQGEGREFQMQRRVTRPAASQG